jgi:hypothetical protein
VLRRMCCCGVACSSLTGTLLQASVHTTLTQRRDLTALLDAYEKDPRCFYLYTGRVRPSGRRHRS